MSGSRYERSFSKKVAKKRADKKASYKSNKGNYPYPWNNLLKDNTVMDMVSLSPESVELRKLDDMRDGYVPELVRLVKKYEDLVESFPTELKKMKKKVSMEKYLSNHFKKSDLMKIENFIRGRDKEQEDDLTGLSESGLVHQPTTSLGKTIKLLEYLKKFHIEDKPQPAMAIFLRLMENEFRGILGETPKLVEKYHRSIAWMNSIAEDQDLIKYQLVTKHEMMPPLNQKGFVKLDSWQEDAIDKMRERKSVILSIPTSGGKTYLSAYLTKSKGRIVFLAPSIPLARQVAAYLTRVTGQQVPFMTDTYQPFLYHKEMIECLSRSKIVVSTPDVFLDYLPEIGSLTKDDNLIVDEIHMMGSNQGDSMEMVSILNHQAMLLGLSATVSNPDDLITWRRAMGEDLEIISSSQRFFNLQTGFWCSTDKQVKNINPLAMLTIDDFTSGNVLQKDLKPTPPDVYHLAKILEENLGDKMGELLLEKYFVHLTTERVTLDEVMGYFRSLIQLLVDNSSNEEMISKVLSNFVPDELVEEETNLLDIITHLRETKNTPVLVFERNTYSLMRLARKLIEQIDTAENIKYPERLKAIEKMEKEARKRLKEMEKAGLLSKKDCGLSDGKSSKDKAEMARIEKKKEKAGLEEIMVEHPQNPTPEFNWCPTKYISESEIEEIDFKLKSYFPHVGDFYHPIIHALWRGIGIYAEGLPDDYLVLVQVMANEKKLGVVLSDKSMTFGVSMPFRNVVIYRDPTTEDDLNPLLFKQMEGRAGRRGQDTKGSVIFAGYSWDRIQELAISEIPKVEGQDSVENIYLPIGAKLAEVSGKEMAFEEILTKNLYRLQSDEDEEETTMEEYQELWEEWTPKAISGDVNLLRMLWRSRNYGCDGVAFYHLVDALEKKFCGGDISENRQIEAAHILSFFIQNKRAKFRSHLLEKPDDFETTWKGIRHSILELGIPLEDDEYLDGRIFISIQMNKLYSGVDDKDYQEIRENFYKFACSLRVVQNYCYYSERVTLAKILGKLFTRCKWILWLSSPLTNFGKEQHYLDLIGDEEIPEGDEEEE